MGSVHCIRFPFSSNISSGPLTNSTFFFISSKIAFDTFQLVAQVNGKVRATIEAPVDISKEDAIALVTSHKNVQRFLEGKTIRKTIYVPGKLVNIVVS